MKRLIIFLSAMITVVGAYAQSLAGRTYSTSFTYQGSPVTIEMKFTSAHRGVEIFKADIKGQGKVTEESGFKYDLDGWVIYVYYDSEDYATYEIDDINCNSISTYSEFGELKLKRVSSTSASSNKGKKRKRR